MTVTHSGSTKQYSENFSRAFGGKKQKAAAESRGKQPARKAGKKKAGKKKAK